MHFDVHAFTQVRIKFKGVEAASHAEALQKIETINLHPIVNKFDLFHETPEGLVAEYVEWSENGIELACVDALTDTEEVDYDNTAWLDEDGHPLGEYTPSERAVLAAEFLNELLASVETLSGIVEQYGLDTLTDLMYLQDAIAKGSSIDDHATSKVKTILERLPSGKHWLTYVSASFES